MQCQGVTSKFRRCTRKGPEGWCVQHKPATAAVSCADVFQYVTSYLSPRDIVSCLGTCRQMRQCVRAWDILRKHMFHLDRGSKLTIHDYIAACNAAPPHIAQICNKIIFQRAEQYVRDCLNMLPGFIENIPLHARVINDWIEDKPKMQLIATLIECGFTESDSN